MGNPGYVCQKVLYATWARGFCCGSCKNGLVIHLQNITSTFTCSQKTAEESMDAPSFIPASLRWVKRKKALSPGPVLEKSKDF